MATSGNSCRWTPQFCGFTILDDESNLWTGERPIFEGSIWEFSMAMGAATIAGWLYFVEDPNLKWMMTGGTPMTMETPKTVVITIVTIINHHEPSIKPHRFPILWNPPYILLTPNGLMLESSPRGGGLWSWLVLAEIGLGTRTLLGQHVTLGSFQKRRVWYISDIIVC